MNELYKWLNEINVTKGSLYLFFFSSDRPIDNRESPLSAVSYVSEEVWVLWERGLVQIEERVIAAI